MEMTLAEPVCTREEDHDDRYAIKGLLRQFPSTKMAFAYGSGVFQQDGYEHLNKETDMVRA